MKNRKDGVPLLTRREFLQWTGTTAAGVGLAGIPELSYGQAKKPKYGGILRDALAYFPMGADAHRNQDFATLPLMLLLYQSLTEIGPVPDLNIYPLLAKKMEVSNDGREYTFTLWEGVKFHHGKELDSGDVKYSIERVLNPATRAPRANNIRRIDSVTVIDKYNLKIKLKESFAPFLNFLTVLDCAIIPAGWEPTPSKPAPGTGPFIFKSFTPNDRFEVTRFDQYWEVDPNTGNRLPYLDGVRARKIVDPTVRWTALRAGDLDAIYGPPTNIVEQAMKDPIPGFHIGYEAIGNAMIHFNLRKPPFDNKKVRQAVAYAIDKEEILKAVFWGLGEVVNNQPFSKRSRNYIPVQERKKDLAKARQLMAEAGYPNGFKTEFLEPDVSYYVESALVATGQLRQIGIEATIKSLDRSAFYPMLRKGDFHFSLAGIDEKYDWDDVYYMYFHSSELGINNVYGYTNKELDKLLDQGRATMRREDRIAIYKKVTEIVSEELPVLYLNKLCSSYALGDYVKGFKKGYCNRNAWHGGGAKYLWLDR